jgi:hypothetical protein
VTGIEPKFMQISEANIPHARIAPKDDKPSALLVSCCKYRAS